MSEKPISIEELETFVKISDILYKKLKAATESLADRDESEFVNVGMLMKNYFTFTEEEMTDDQFNLFLDAAGRISDWYESGLSLNGVLHAIGLSLAEGKPALKKHKEDLELRKKFLN